MCSTATTWQIIGGGRLCLESTSYLPFCLSFSAFCSLASSSLASPSIACWLFHFHTLSTRSLKLTESPRLCFLPFLIQTLDWRSTVLWQCGGKWELFMFSAVSYLWYGWTLAPAIRWQIDKICAKKVSLIWSLWGCSITPSGKMLFLLTYLLQRQRLRFVLRFWRYIN